MIFSGKLKFNEVKSLYFTCRDIYVIHTLMKKGTMFLQKKSIGELL